ncbi:DnaJ sub C member 21 [Phytophthora boehmeriae]|uniref:DnaJ sub C member 21 n=1 Tax=Phytophthora boehmeriae TaxID=109152 RepID=A0A8T1WLH5_9STRA|nr:DnaJ sub C member 21 [Phytophthora boehmeriae]
MSSDYAATLVRIRHDRSEDEHPDADTRSDGSQWSSFGQIPSDASDSLSFQMRSPESEQDDSDEDYAPSQASLSSLEGSHSPVSSVDTNDLEFPSDMESGIV